MSVTDFECAIAKSQIGRYISGENLAPEIARQLEAHISACPRCKQVLEEKKNSLEAIIDDPQAVQVPVQPVPMISEGLSLKLEPTPIPTPISEASQPIEMQPAVRQESLSELSDRARMSLREQLVAQAKAKQAEESEIANVSAFAYKDPSATEAEQPAPKKKGFSLSSFALFTKVPDEGPKPALTAENLRSAKAALANGNGSMKKPILYLCALSAVVVAMSFIVKDPTTLFGGKAASVTTGSKAVVPFKDKTKGKAPTNLDAEATKAQSFAKTSAAIKAKALASKTAPKKLVPTNLEPVATRANGFALTKPKKAPAKITTIKPTAATKTTRSTRRWTKKRRPTNSKTTPSNQGVVKLYDVDSTPQQEQK